MILVDTSVWIECFKPRSGFSLTDIVDFDAVVTCLPVIQEVLQGFCDEEAFQQARSAMMALPRVASPISDRIYDRAIDLYRAARRQGLTVRSSVDCLIAACALENHLTVLHRGRDYAQLAQVSSLRQQQA